MAIPCCPMTDYALVTFRLRLHSFGLSLERMEETLVIGSMNFHSSCDTLFVPICYLTQRFYNTFYTFNTVFISEKKKRLCCCRFRLAKSIKIAIALSVLFSFGLVLYVPVSVLWPMIQSKFRRTIRYGETMFRSSVMIAASKWSSHFLLVEEIRLTRSNWRVKKKKKKNSQQYWQSRYQKWSRCSAFSRRWAWPRSCCWSL